VKSLSDGFLCEKSSDIVFFGVYVKKRLMKGLEFERILGEVPNNYEEKDCKHDNDYAR
jgi:hypothetical protein